MSITSDDNYVQSDKVEIGSPVLTRYERARIIGARALQISHGAPVLIQTEDQELRPIEIAKMELKARFLPVGMARHLPNGMTQIIPIQKLGDMEFIGQMKEEESLIQPSSKEPTTEKEGTDLTKVKGIGSTRAEDLKIEGFKTAEQIAKSTVEELTEISGVGSSTAESFIQNAREAVGMDKEIEGGTDLTKVKGIGDSTKEDLKDAGFETAEQIANSSIKELTKIKGIGKKSAEKYIQNAKDSIN